MAVREPQPELRSACRDCRATSPPSKPAKHRFFVFLDAAILPDNKLVNIALDDAYFLGVLSSRIHVTWALAAGSHLGVGNDPVYVKTACFDKFPFPAATDAQQARIRGLAEQLDAHRKRQQAQHPKLTLTDMYNVLEKLRAGEPLTAKDKTVHEQGLVSVLREIHDELDAAVCDAYGWPVALADEEILARLVALNAERAAEEAQGLIRWLRPEYQAPSEYGIRNTQYALIQEDAPIYDVSPETRPLLPWPTRMAEQAQVVRGALVALGGPASAAQIAAAFAAAPPDRVAELLETLVTLGQARSHANGGLSRNACSPRARTLEWDFWLANQHRNDDNYPSGNEPKVRRQLEPGDRWRCEFDGDTQCQPEKHTDLKIMRGPPRTSSPYFRVSEQWRYTTSLASYKRRNHSHRNRKRTPVTG